MKIEFSQAKGKYIPLNFILYIYQVVLVVMSFFIRLSYLFLVKYSFTTFSLAFTYIYTAQNDKNGNAIFINILAINLLNYIFHWSSDRY